MTTGQIVGLLLMFCLALVPAGLFIGVVFGGILNLRHGLRWALAALAAAVLAYGIVIYPGTAGDEIQVGLLTR